MEKITVYGLPLNPAHLVEQIERPSFCVSFATRQKLGKQLDQAIALVNANPEGMLLVDNGAYSHWNTGGQMTDDYVEEFARWAADIADRCPNAVVVVPDVIGGSWQDNQRLIDEWGGISLIDDWSASTDLGSDRSMVMWHLDEPISVLLHRCEGFAWIGIGSSGEYGQVGTAKWHARMQEVFAALDAWERDYATPNGIVRPRIHLMRAQAFAHLYPVDSSDSTNVAMNHNRQLRKTGQDVRAFAGRVDAKIQASAGPAAKYQTLRPLNAGWELDRWEEQRQADLVAYVEELAIFGPEEEELLLAA